MNYHRPMRSVLVALVAVLGLALTGCGDQEGGAGGATDDTSTSSSASPDATDAPACTEVWKAGKKLPQGYDGCAGEQGTLAADEPMLCSSGQKIFTYDDRYYAVPGAKVIDVHGSLLDSAKFRRAQRTCTG